MQENAPVNRNKFRLNRVRYTGKSFPWWRHQMETFSALLAICAGISPVSSEFPTQRPVTRSFVILFDLRLNKRLNKQSWSWWVETLLCPLWRHCNALSNTRHGEQKYPYLTYFQFHSFRLLSLINRHFFRHIELIYRSKGASVKSVTFRFQI